jgi:hypothetical protein
MARRDLTVLQETEVADTTETEKAATEVVHKVKDVVETTKVQETLSN